MLNSAPISPHRRDSLAIVLIAPAAAVVFTAMLLPLAYAIVMSLFDYRQGFETQGRFLFLQNYVRFFQDKIAIQSLFLTLTPDPIREIAILIAIPIEILVHRRHLRLLPGTIRLAACWIIFI